MSNQFRNMPLGGLTDNLDMYCQSWTNIGEFLCERFDCKLLAFDPDFLLEDSKTGATFSVPSWAAKRMLAYTNEKLRSEAVAALVDWLGKDVPLHVKSRGVQWLLAAGRLAAAGYLKIDNSGAVVVDREAASADCKDYNTDFMTVSLGYSTGSPIHDPCSPPLIFSGIRIEVST